MLYNNPYPIHESLLNKRFFTLPPIGISSHGLWYQLFQHDVGPLVGSFLLQGRSLNSQHSAK